MAGPRAPIGSLSQHASRSAQLARNETSSLSRPPRATTKKHKKAGHVDDEESDSASDSDSDGDNARDGAEHLLQMVASRSSPLKHKAKQTSSGLSKMPTTTVKAPTQNAPPERKTGASAMKTEATSSDSSSDAESESSSSSETSSESEPESGSKGTESQGKPSKTGKSANVPKNMKKAGGPSPVAESESSSSESESESLAEEPTLKKADPKTKKEKIQKDLEESSSEDSEDSTTDQEGGAGINGASNAGGDGSSDSDSSSSEAQDDSSSEDESGSDEEADVSLALDMRKGGMADTRIPEIVANDFHLRKAGEGVDASDVSQVFAQAKMEGKQVWYFTAPASIPIEVVEKLEIPLERAQQGLSILSHSGDDYGVAFEDASTSRSIKLFIPNKAGDKYGMLNRPVDQAMHLKRITQFSPGNERSTTFAQSNSTTSRPARPQPAGLKARYNPIGVSNRSMGKIGVDTSSESEGDVEMGQAPPLPPSQETPRKRKGPELVQTPKSEKTRKRKHATDEEPPSSQLTATGQKAKKARVGWSQPASASKAARMTPVVPPYPATNGTSSKAGLASAQKKAALDSEATPNKELANSSRKESVVPLPANFRRLSQSQSTLDTDLRSSLVREPEKAGKKEHKGKSRSKGRDSTSREKSAPPVTAATPSKFTPITPPIPAGQRQL